jgi:antitoxin component YwqK of YwqJK toxin-antitoxin module
MRTLSAIAGVVLSLALVGTARSHAAPAAPPHQDVKRTWYANGQLAEERRYVNGAEDGVHRGWWSDGKPRFEYAYQAGLLQGLSREWMPSGALYREQRYERGQEAGLQRLYWPDGRVRASYVMRHGRRFGLMGAKGCVTWDDSTTTVTP